MHTRNIQHTSYTHTRRNTKHARNTNPMQHSHHDNTPTLATRYTHRHPKEERFWVECKKWFECTEVRLEDHLPDDYIVANFHIFRITLKT